MELKKSEERKLKKVAEKHSVPADELLSQILKITLEELDKYGS